MREPGVDADDPYRARQQRCKLGQAPPRRNDAATHTLRDSFAARLLLDAAPWEHDREAGVHRAFEERFPVGFGPELVVAARRVQENGVRRVGSAVLRRRLEAEPRCARRLVAERLTGEAATAVDQMPRRIDPVAMRVEQRHDRLTHAPSIGAVHRPPREPRDQRSLELLLQVDYCVVSLVRELSPERGPLPPRRTRERVVSPAPQSDGNNPAHTPVEPHQRSKRLFGHPVDADPRTMLMQIVDDRHRVHDVAQRRRTNDQGAGHGAMPQMACEPVCT